MGYVGNQTTNAYTSITKQDITGNGGTAYTLDHAVANANEIEVFVNNVRQEPAVAYMVSGTALTMTGNVAASDDFYVVFQGKAIQTKVPADNSVSPAKLSLGTAGINLSTGTTSQRDSSPSAGDVRFNSEYETIEFYTGSEWHIANFSNANSYGLFYLVVGGGGGGATQHSGGGGGGAVITNWEGTPYTVSTGTVYTVTVGAGAPQTGVGGGRNGTHGESSFFGNIVAGGGGGGGSYNGLHGLFGSSGGGGGSDSGQGGGGSHGGRGGDGATHNSGGGGGGGGGGAGQNGEDAVAGSSGGAGDGGDGVKVTIDGNNYYYGGGGGGGCIQNGTLGAGDGGLGGGGGGGHVNSVDRHGNGGGSARNAGADGGHQTSQSTGNYGGAGGANTGGGGGGAGSQASTGGAGGSGVVILRMKTADYSGTTTGSPTVSTSGDDTILVFTASGSYTA